MQERQHSKEEMALRYLKEHLNHTFTDVHSDYTTGIDFWLDGKPYDLKASKSNKLTVFKLYKGKWYSPLLSHMEVPYAYTVYGENGEIKALKIIKKEDVIYYLKTSPCFTEYTGDGNVNINVDISNLSGYDLLIIT